MCNIDSSFGQLIDSTTYISLTEDSILITNTTLYCVSANSKSPDIFWSYVDPSGTKTYLTAITNNNSTGISTLHVYSNRPGEYSCLVTTDDGSMKTHSVKMLDVTLYTGENFLYAVLDTNHCIIIDFDSSEYLVLNYYFNNKHTSLRCVY